MTLYSRLVRPLLFCLDPEAAHSWALAALRVVSALPRLPRALAAWHRARDPRLSSTVLGMTFPNPVGLAAGFDKNAVAVPALAALGFGFVEIGTVTARPQPGNPSPRLVRLPADEALWNRLGFNNDGAEVVARRLAALRARPVPLGVNIGRSRAAANEEAANDYLTSFRLLAPRADYVVVNVSSPNTPGLRDLQTADRLEPLLTALVGERDRLAGSRKVALLVKVSPDCTNEDLEAIAGVARKSGADGLVATNTTTGRPAGSVIPSTIPSGEGGVSGKPLRRRATEVIRFLYRVTGGTMPIIGVGGVVSTQDVLEKLEAGASLVQLYTGLVYEGPGVAARILSGLSRVLDERGIARVSDLVGCRAGGG